MFGLRWCRHLLFWVTVITVYMKKAVIAINSYKKDKHNQLYELCRMWCLHIHTHKIAAYSAQYIQYIYLTTVFTTEGLTLAVSQPRETDRGQLLPSSYYCSQAG